MTINPTDPGAAADNEASLEGPDIEVPTTDPGTATDDDGSLESPDIEIPNSSASADGTEKSGGLGTEGTIPDHPDGIAAGHTGIAANFNPEEDEAAR